MKASLFKLSVVTLCFIVSMQSCEVLTEGDECKGSEMDTVERLLYPRITFTGNSKQIAPDAFLGNAEKFTITGSIRKEYCTGKISGDFSYNPTFFPLTMTIDEWDNGLYFLQSYQYKFSNKEDELILIMRIKAYTTDGRIYESGELVARFKYADIQYDVNKLRYYIMIYVPGSMGWFRVTS